MSFEYTIDIHLPDISYLFGESPPSIFPLSLGIFISVIHFAKSKLMARSVPVLKSQEKNVLFRLLGIYLFLRNQNYLQKI